MKDLTHRLRKAVSKQNCEEISLALGETLQIGVDIKDSLLVLNCLIMLGDVYQLFGFTDQALFFYNEHVFEPSVVFNPNNSI